MITIRELKIERDHDLYAQERELRNKVLLRPFGLADHLWEMHDSYSFHLIAVKDSAVVGCVILRPFPENNSAQLLQMAVESSLQGYGIGKKLVSGLIKIAREQDIKEIFCHSRESAISFYEKLGFEKYDEYFEEVGIKHIKMKLIVDSSKID